MDSKIEKVINGKRYTATRRITGKIKIRQSIIFMGREEHDSKTYDATEKDKAEMDITADLIFWQLLTRGWPGQSPLEPHAPHE